MADRAAGNAAVPPTPPGRSTHLVTDSDVRPAAEPRDGFRPDLEGLRAVAVGLVLLYHAAVPGFSGGYVGVDVFFVLSGFLITGLLLREVRRTGTVSLPNFYARRARRLLPASALVLLVTVVASFFMMPPLRVPDVAGDAAAAAMYVSNMRFAFQATDYLQAELAPSPILHFWSLGVEEQFYIFWPAIVLLATRGRGDARRRQRASGRASGRALRVRARPFSTTSEKRGLCAPRRCAPPRPPSSRSRSLRESAGS